MTTTLDDQLLLAVSQSVEAQLGLHYPRERWSDLERGLCGAATELGIESVVGEEVEQVIDLTGARAKMHVGDPDGSKAQ